MLPAPFIADPERRARFEREARVLAALNHPHIAAIYGVEESHRVCALILELVDGDTLADRIARAGTPAYVVSGFSQRGGPLDEALAIARQIADALEAAHEKGIIHRDLKPANIKITPAGIVKVLDFGLAKIYANENTGPDPSQSPTITAGTREGMILGTPAYMSPEQARGQVVDKRTDIWAFGCVLYEMLTGRRAFAGDEVSDVLASVLAREPDWTLLPHGLSPLLCAYIKRCLHKDRRQRVGDAQSVRLVLEGAFETAAQSVAAAPPRWRRALPVVMTGIIAVLMTGLVAWSLVALNPARPSTVSRFVITPPESAPITQAGGRMVIISPDGRRIVYVGEDAKRGRILFVRDIDALEARAVPGTENATSPFFSPDGAWIGFERGTALVKVAASGGPPLEIVDAGTDITGSAWGADDTVIFAKNDGLYRVAADGGSVERLTPEAVAGEGYIAPHVLPGGKAVVFYLRKGADWASDRLAVLSLETGEQRNLIGGGVPRYASSGHLVFTRGTTLMAAPFDPARLEVTGDPVALLENVRRTGAGAAQYWLSENGTLVYRPGTAGGRTLAWVGRDGAEEPLAVEPRDYSNPRVSPDGGRVAVLAAQDIWIYDLARGTTTRLTFDPANDVGPLWTPDGQRVVFASGRAGTFDLYWRRADGTGPEERLTTGSQHEFPSSWGNGGRDLVFLECRTANAGPCDVAVLSLADRQAKVLLQTEFDEGSATVSPDGRWLAYDSNESGQSEIFVRPFLDVESRRWQVSTGGGTEPLWGPKGDELFYRTATSLMVVPFQTGATLTFGKAAALFNLGRYTAPGGTDYDIAPKGDRFMVAPVASKGGAADQIVVVQGWVEELKRRVPVN